MNKQMKVTGHGDQSERRNDGTQPNARRDSWSKTEDHDVIGRIKTIELRNKLQPEFTRMADSYLDGVWCRLSNTDFCIVGYSESVSLVNRTWSPSAPRVGLRGTGACWRNASAAGAHLMGRCPLLTLPRRFSSTAR